MLATSAAQVPPALFLPAGPSSQHAASLPLADELSTRSLLHGPSRCGKTSLLMQFAFARARRGLTTLFVCQSREKLWVQRPAPPRDDGCSESETIAALQKISIKYVRGERDLRELLVTFHLSSERLPNTLIIDDLPAIMAEGTASSSDTPSPHGSSASPGGPSPSAKAGHANMHLALTVGLASHATDLIDAAYRDGGGGGGGGGGGAPGVLLVSCSSPPADMVQLFSRWLPTHLRVTRGGAAGGAPPTPGSASRTPGGSAGGARGSQQPHAPAATFTLAATHAMAPPDGLAPADEARALPAQLQPVQYQLVDGRLVTVDDAAPSPPRQAAPGC
mgnify:CR=1 FL=1